MGFLSNFRRDLENAKRNKAANINGKNLKGILTKFKEERDKIERETGTRPQIDSTIAVYDITGDADMVIIAKFKTREFLSDFVKKVSAIPNVENTLTHLVLNTIKEDNRLIE